MHPAPDDFQLTYYADDCGTPGTVVAGPFSESGGMLTVVGPWETDQKIAGVMREAEYYATHAPVSLAAQVPYWIEISNAGSDSCKWYWESTATGHGFQTQSIGQSPPQYQTADAVPQSVFFDITHCQVLAMDRSYVPGCYPAPINDDCSAALPIQVGDVVDLDITSATTDGPAVVPISTPDELVNYFPFGDRQVNRDVWFTHQAICSAQLNVDVCDSTFDSKAALYEGTTCPPTQPIAISDDECGPERGLQTILSGDVIAGHSYLIRVGGYRQEFGIGTVELSYASPHATSLRTYSEFAQCFNGACGSSSCIEENDPCCALMDFNSDASIDSADYINFVAIFSGP